MKLGEESIGHIEAALKELVAYYPSNTEDLPVTDIYFHPVLEEDNALSIQNDEGEIARADIEEWNEAEADNDFYDQTSDVLKQCIRRIRSQIEKMGVFRPFSLFLTDTDGEIVTELLLIDDKIALLDDTFIKGMNDDLDKFLDKLMKE